MITRQHERYRVVMRHTESARNVGLDASKKGDRSLFKLVSKIPSIHTPLSENGYRQAIEIGKILEAAGWDFDFIEVSGFFRTQEVARLLGYDVPIDVVPEFNERAHGVTEDMDHVEMTRYIKRNGLNRFYTDPYFFKFEGSESFADLRARVEPAFERFLDRPEAHGLLIAHSQNMRTIEEVVTGMSVDNFALRLRTKGAFAIENGECFHLRHRMKGSHYDLVKKWKPLLEPTYGPNGSPTVLNI